MNDYLTSVQLQFKHYKKIAEKSFDQIPEEMLFWQASEESNSIATIVKHLSGNMLSRWTDFLESDGEKSWRNRDSEFENDIESKEELLEIWEKGWDCLLETLDSLAHKDLAKKVLIRNEPHTVTEAINRQLAHYSYHIGQIVFIGKMVAGEDWHALTIPKGKSEQYNKKKFNERRTRRRLSEE
ncbi:DUF1572 family protein [Halocola ammonii]